MSKTRIITTTIIPAMIPGERPAWAGVGTTEVDTEVVMEVVTEDTILVVNSVADDTELTMDEEDAIELLSDGVGEGSTAEGVREALISTEVDISGTNVLVSMVGDVKMN